MKQKYTEQVLLIQKKVENNMKDRFIELLGEELSEEELDKKAKKELGGIIGGGFDPIYLISQKERNYSVVSPPSSG